jgi:hypothetical protein
MVFDLEWAQNRAHLHAQAIFPANKRSSWRRCLSRDVDAATLFLNHSWTVDGGHYGPLSYRLSPIELVTLGVAML